MASAPGAGGDTTVPAPDRDGDLRLLGGSSARIGLLLLAAVLVVLPWIVPGYRLFTLDYMAVFVVVGLGMHLLVGDTGQVSLGHAGFLAIGAYTTVLVTAEVGAPFPLAMVAAGGVSAAFGFLLGLPALRLRGPYLAIATLGFGLAVTLIIGQTAWFGGHMGLVLSTPRIGPFTLTGDVARYYVVVGTTLALALAARNLSVTRVGRAFRAIRDSEVASALVGVDVARYKTLSFAVSAAFTGIAGGLLALVVGFVSPGVFSLTLSVMFLAMVVIGGIGSLGGAVAGSLLMGYLSLEMDAFEEMPLVGDALEGFSARFMSVAGLPNVGWVVTGLAIVLTVVVEPRGLAGVGRRALRLWVRLRTGGNGAPARGVG